MRLVNVKHQDLAVETVSGGERFAAVEDQQ